jgi:hypothetical protein
VEDDPMSIASLVAKFGKSVELLRPTYATQSDGVVGRTFAKQTDVVGFFQPSGVAEEIQEGRATTRTTGDFYLAGRIDVRIDDELNDGTLGAGRRWRVLGALNPGETGYTGAAPHLNMTVVTVVEVEPYYTVVAP